jgi:hypothetical protein
MGNKGALTRADDVLIVADGVDLRGWDSAHSLAMVWVAEDNNCGEERRWLAFVFVGGRSCMGDGGIVELGRGRERR